MNRRFPSDFDDVGEIFLRRRWWLILIPLIVIAISLPIIFTWPKTWRSETTIQVVPQQVPPTYITSTVTTDATARLEMITQAILSRTHLQRIIDQFGLYRDQKKATQEDIVELMKKDIHVDVLVDPQQPLDRRGSLAFKISYEGSDPVLVQQVTRQLGNLFTEENLKIRQKQADATRDFIDGELEKGRQEMDKQEGRLRAFQSQHAGTLPEQQGVTLGVLNQLEIALASNADAIARAQDRKTYNESLLSFLSKNAPVDANGNPVPVQTIVQTQLEARKSELLYAEQMYTPRHPDVVRLKGEVAALEKLSTQPASSQPTAPANGANAAYTAAAATTTGQLRSEILALEQEIKERTKKYAEIEGKIKDAEARLERLPMVQVEMSEITRDYQRTEKTYESLLDKKINSSMAAAMEQGAKGEAFQTLDPASLPDKPVRPNLLTWSLLACLGGILCGLIVGTAVEFRDKTINCDKDVVFYLPAPLLASLPMIARAEMGNKKRPLQLKGQSKVITIEPSARSERPVGESPEPASATGIPVAPVLSGPSLAAKESRGQAQPPDLRTGSKELPEALSALWQGSRTDAGAFAVEQLRIVRTRLRELMRVRTMRTLMVTSAVQGEGKTLVSANLAFAMSQLEGLKVLLVDADLRKASLGTFLNLKPKTGLSTYLMNGKGLSDVRVQIKDNLAVVPTLSLWENTTELLNGRRMEDFLHEALRDYDLVIVDAPPMIPVADAQVLISMVDGALLVVRAGACPFDLACSAAELLQPKLVGVILNGVSRLPHRRYYYGYYGYYGRASENRQWSKS
jgi:polysaccharide chain length determinant protein (PEP-CTERM system associated)